MSELNTPETQRRERRPNHYYIAQKTHEFNTRSEVERHLTEQGGLKEGESIVVGRSVEAQQASVFR